MAERPVVNPQSRRVGPENVAKVRNYGGPMVQGPREDNQTASFLAGLAMFNKGLWNYADTAIGREADAATQAGAAAALAQGMDNRGAPGEAEGANTPETGVTPAKEPPFAFGEHWQAGYQSAVRQKFVARAMNDYREAALLEVEKPDFNPQEFSDKWWGAQLAGADQSTLLAASEARLKADDEVAGLHRREALKRATAIEEEANLALLTSEIRADMSPQEIAAAWRDKINPELAARGLTRKTGAERVNMLFDHLNSLSLAAGGQPELFDALTEVDPTTKLALKDMNPRVAASIEVARKQATDLREKNLKEAAEADRFAAKQRILEDINTGAADGYLTPDFLAQMISPIGLTDSEAMSLWQAYTSRSRVEDKSAASEEAMLAGRGWTIDKKEQQKVIEKFTAPHVGALASAIEAGDTARAAAYGEQIAKVHQTYQSEATSERLAGLFEMHAKMPPPKDGKVPNSFKAAVETFKALPPNLQREYVKGDAYALFTSYIAGVSSGAGEDASFTAAHNAMDPQVRERAKVVAKGDPQYRERIKKIAAESVSGASGWPFAGALGYRAENADKLTELWIREAELRAQAASNLTSAELEAQSADWFKENFVLVRDDWNTSVAIPVPPKSGGEGAQKALQQFYNDTVKAVKLDKREDGWGVIMQLTNAQQGTYAVYLSKNGSQQDLIGSTSLAKLQKDYADKFIVGADDRNTITALTQKIDAGTVTFEDMQAARKTIGKLEATGMMTSDMRAKLRRADDSVFKQASESMIKVVPLDSAVDRVGDPPPPKVGVTKRDPRLTREVAQQFLAADPMGHDHRSLAKAMITVGEEVMLGRYEDPAKGAGFNIGMGYNFDANAKTLHKDLERAGVVRDQVQKVIDGQAQITARQAMNLLTLQMDRYESAAKAAVEKRQPGAWDRVPARAKAALIDVAWQAGSPGGFTKALDALIQGDQNGFAESLVVTYVDSRSGKRKVDTRRNQMRSALLAGPARFKALVDNHGKPTQLASK